MESLHVHHVSEVKFVSSLIDPVVKSSIFIKENLLDFQYFYNVNKASVQTEWCLHAPLRTADSFAAS